MLIYDTENATNLDVHNWGVQSICILFHIDNIRPVGIAIIHVNKTDRFSTTQKQIEDLNYTKK